jgi:soluble lytic murein transglycosylase-like protein
MELNNLKEGRIMKFKIFIVFLSLCMSWFFTFPEFIIDEYVEYQKYFEEYKWLSFDVYSAAVFESNKYNNVTVDNVLAIIHHETLHVPAWKKATVTSYAGAVGYMQIMPLHAKNYKISVRDLNTMEINIMVGTNIYSHYKRMYGNNDKKAIMAYNAGPYSNFSKYDNDWYLYGILKYTKKTLSKCTWDYINYM